MSKKRISFLTALLACGAVCSVYAAKALAVPETGTFVILTVDEDTGEAAGNVGITVTQLQAEVVRVRPVHTETNEFGILYHASPAGLYNIRAEGGSNAIVYLPSGAHDVYVILTVRSSGS